MISMLMASGGTEALAEKLTSLLGGLPPQAIIFIISMIPILELRGGLIAASLLNIPMWEAIGFCIVGNILPIPFILLFIEKILDWMERCKIGWISKFALWLKARGTGPKAATIRKYEFVGLLLFVGIPLPGTGAWTGTLAASILDMDFKKSVLYILLGVLLAGAIMLAASFGVFGAINLIK